MTENITKVSVALGDRDREIVGALAREKGLSFSAALRIIVREWEQKDQQTLPILEVEEGQG